MPSRNRYRSASKFTNQSTRTASGARTAWRFTEKAAVGLARWATTDHTGSAKFLASHAANGVYRHHAHDLGYVRDRDPGSLRCWLSHVPADCLRDSLAAVPLTSSQVVD
jgi:hypothetical protein